MQLKNGEVEGRRTPVGIIPTKEELALDGCEVDDKDLETILSIDVERWKQEMSFREGHLDQFERLPEAIWEAHRRVAGDLDLARGVPVDWSGRRWVGSGHGSQETPGPASRRDLLVG